MDLTDPFTISDAKYLSKYVEDSNFAKFLWSDLKKNVYAIFYSLFRHLMHWIAIISVHWFLRMVMMLTDIL